MGWTYALLQMVLTMCCAAIFLALLIPQLLGWQPGINGHGHGQHGHVSGDCSFQVASTCQPLTRVARLGWSRRRRSYFQLHITEAREAQLTAL